MRMVREYYTDRLYLNIKGFEDKGISAEWEPKIDYYSHSYTPSQNCCGLADVGYFFIKKYEKMKRFEYVKPGSGVTPELVALIP